MTARKTNVANVFETTLTVAMAPTDLTATVAATTNGPASPALLVIEPDKPTSQLEIIYFDGTFTGTTFVTSGIGNRYLTGSAAASGLTHPVGSKVRCAILSQHIIDIYDYIDAVKAVSTTAGDVAVGTGAGTWKRLGIGAAYKAIGANSDATDLTYLDTLASLLTAQGDLPYASAANTPARLAKGTALQALLMNSGATAPQWAASLQSLLTTTGDLVYASSANTPARLGVGSGTQVLGVSGGVPAWVSAASSLAIAVRVSNSATQSTANNTDTALTWDTNVSDADGYHSTVSNTSRFTVPTGKGSKLHCFQARCEWQTNGSGDRYLAWRLNGSTLLSVVNLAPMNGGRNGGMENTLWYTPADADYLEAIVFQQSGGSINVNPSTAESRHSVRVLRVG